MPVHLTISIQRMEMRSKGDRNANQKQHQTYYVRFRYYVFDPASRSHILIDSPDSWAGQSLNRSNP